MRSQGRVAAALSTNTPAVALVVAERCREQFVVLSYGVD